MPPAIRTPRHTAAVVDLMPMFRKLAPNAPVQGFLAGNRLELRCSNSFTAQMLDKPEILEVVSRKASVMLNRPVRAYSVDVTAKPQGNPHLEQLMSFGREHSDIIKIKNN